MGFNKRAVSGRERGIGFLILVVLVLTAAGVLFKQGCYDESIYKGAMAANGTATEGGEIKGFEFEGKIADGFERMGEGEYYISDNLYEKINGKADLYHESGFESLSSLRVVSGENEGLWFEVFVYEMSNEDAAFAVYSGQKRSGASELDWGGRAYRTSDAVFAAAGSYYIEAVGGGEEAEVMQGKLGTVKAIVDSVKSDAGGGEGISVVDFFPGEGLSDEGVGLSVSGAFGYDGFSNVYSGLYEGGAVAYVSAQGSGEEARQMADGYYDFLTGMGATVLEGRGSEAVGGEVQVVDLYGSIETIEVIGEYAFGVHQAGSVEAAVELHGKLKEQMQKYDIGR